MPNKLSNKVLDPACRDLEREVRQRAADLQEANRKLEESEKRYRFLYEFSPFPLVEMDSLPLKEYIDSLGKKGIDDLRAYFEQHPEDLPTCASKIKMLDVNNAMVDLFKAGEKERLLQQGPGTLFPGEYKNLCDCIIAFAEERGSFECEVTGRTFEGEDKVLYLRWSVIPGTDGSKTRMLGSLIDITRRKELVEQLAFFKAAADAANFGNQIIDNGGHLIYANRAFAEMHGYDLEEIVGEHVRTFHTNAQMEKIRQWGDRLKAGEEIKNVEIWHKKKDGTVFPTLMNATIVKDEKGSPLCTYSSAVDISELKQVEQALQEREKELEASNIKLQEMNDALKVLLQTRETDKTELEEKVVKNVKELCLPVLERLRRSGLDERQLAYLDVLESSLVEIISPFVRALSTHYPGLTPSELTIANLIKEGKESKDIAEMLNLSKRSVDTYRHRIRSKLGITHKKVNLRTHLHRHR